MRLDERLADEAKDQFLRCSTAADEVGRDRDGVLLRHAEHPAVEQLVVEAAETQAVVNGVGAVERPPAHVGRVETNGLGTEPPVVAAHGAAVLVGDQHLLSELRIPTAKTMRSRLRRSDLERLHVDSNRFTQVPVQRVREVGFEYGSDRDRDFGRAAALQPTKGVQKKQGLVRGPLTAP